MTVSDDLVRNGPRRDDLRTWCDQQGIDVKKHIIHALFPSREQCRGTNRTLAIPTHPP
jgi:hypothetical protein